MAAGANGIMFASAIACDESQVALYTELRTENDKLDVNDPSGTLPRYNDPRR